MLMIHACTRNEATASGEEKVQTEVGDILMPTFLLFALVYTQQCPLPSLRQHHLASLSSCC
jgi:hypothetical protein